MNNFESENHHTNGETPGSGAQEVNLVETVVAFVSAYGWYIVIGIGICIYLWKTRFEEQWNRWRQKKADSRIASEYHENPQQYVSRNEEMAAARMRMQEQNDNLSLQNAIKMKEKAEQKRLEKIKEWENQEQGQGTRLGTKVDNDAPSTMQRKKANKSNDRLRGEYNPLMGSGGGTTYRPNSRNCSSDGG